MDFHSSKASTAYLTKQRQCSDMVENDTEQLRKLILGGEIEQLKKLQERLDDPAQQVDALSHILPEAVAKSIAKDYGLSQALTPTIENIIRRSIRSDINSFADAIFPVMGPAIRKSIAETFKQMIQSLNTTLEKSLSWQGIKWRLEAVRTGKTFAEVAILHSLVYRVEQVFLIHKDSGMLIKHVSSELVEKTEDADLVSAMLTAIRDFVKDSFHEESSRSLDSIQIGEISLWISPGPSAILACAIRGSAPESLRERMNSRIEHIHQLAAGLLESYDGDADALSMIDEDVEACCQAQYKKEQKKVSPLLYLFSGALLMALCVWLFVTWQHQSRLQDYVIRISKLPGVIVTTAAFEGDRYVISGLKDPLSKNLQSLLPLSGLDVSDIEYRMRLYASMDESMVFARAERLLSPPSTVKLNLTNGVLAVAGEAGFEWKKRAAFVAQGISGIEKYDDSELVNSDIQLLNPPSSVTLQLDDGHLTVSGEADHAWSSTVATRAIALAAVTSVDVSQLLDSDLINWHELNDRLKGVVIKFKVNSQAQHSYSEQKLKELAILLQNIDLQARRLGRSIVVELIGRADASGRRDLNDVLSFQRAQHIADSLISLDVSESILRALGVGASKPIAMQGDEDKSREINRSVTFAIVDLDTELLPAK